MDSKYVKIIAMYLPQFHEIPENNEWWGDGFTDWVSVKTAAPLYKGHRQPRVPLNDNYYDLTDIETLKWQSALAKKYGIYGFGIYHYWFSSDLKVLTKPAELLLQNKEIEMPFFFAWDNCSWVRTWSRYKHNTNAWSPKFDKKNCNQADNTKGILAQLKYGSENDWKIHFEYLNLFFRDSRYIKISGRPVFVIWNYNKKDILKSMCDYWDFLAKEAGYNGIYFISRLNPYDSMKGFDGLFTYEPMFSAWQNRNIIYRAWNKLTETVIKDRGITFYEYNSVWKRILKHAKHNKDYKVMYGGFVCYDDTPRRGKHGKIIKGESPELFKKHLKKLLDISHEQGKEFVFLTAWNEWGEGAYLEPDKEYHYKFLKAIGDLLTEGPHD